MCRISSDMAATLVLTAVLGIIGYFLAETCNSIKTLEKDVITIREKIIAFEATRLSRQEIMTMISEYHTTHLPAK